MPQEEQSPGPASAAKKPGLTVRAAARVDGYMATKLHWAVRTRDLAFHGMAMVWDQVMAVVPITLLQVAALGIFFRQTALDPLGVALGSVSAIVGLVMFLEGLRIVIMPLAEMIGTELPTKMPLWVVLMVSFVLGVLVTYAEPAIASLRPLASLVDPSRAPYLYYVMNQQQELLVVSIGIGVGFAAVAGTLRFIRDWPLKPMIYACLLPTIGLSCYCMWGNPDLQPVIGMAWDCGGVTTGPVTVPILLALGIGVMRSQRQRKAAQASLANAVAANAGQALEGFGIVTLASLLPILMVLLLCTITAVIIPYDEVLATAQASANAPATTSVIDESPLKEVINSIRSIAPLILALCLIIWILLRRSLPPVNIWVTAEDTSTHARARAASDPLQMGIRSKSQVAAALDATANNRLQRSSLAAVKYAVALEGVDVSTTSSRSGASSMDGVTLVDDASHHGPQQATSTAAAGATAVTDVQVPIALGAGKDVAMTVEAPTDLAAPAKASCFNPECMHKNGLIIAAMLFTQLGMIFFSWGITYAFTALGDQTGSTLPAAFLTVPYEPNSPYYSYAGGLVIVMVVIFLLGVLATRAEPALQVLGGTVEKLSGGKFTSNMLIGAVCVGVAIGMCAGAAKILYSVPVIYFILAKYFVAVGLTIITGDAITAVAWDSAGVTTGPVTVPFVLSIGIGFANAVDSPEGFGMLTIMSVAPIISVLLTSLMRKPVGALKRYASSRISRSSSRHGSDDASTHSGVAP